MKTDEQVKQDVTAELAWDPAVNAASIGVAVRSGIVTLSGTLDTHVQKHAVERAVRRVAGVRGIALDLEVRLAPGHARTDSEIASALERHARREAHRIAVDVEGGVVTLRGTVDTLAERQAAVGTAFAARGVSRVVDQLDVAA